MEGNNQVYHLHSFFSLWKSSRGISALVFFPPCVKTHNADFFSCLFFGGFFIVGKRCGARD